MSEGAGDGRCSDASSLRRDLANLVTWAHSHGTICNQIPALDMVQSTGQPSRDNSLLWICGAGHAYHWHCGKLDLRSRAENEAAEKRKRLVSSEASPRKDNSDEKRKRMTKSFERSKADKGSHGRSSGVTQQKDRVYIKHSDPREHQQNSRAMKSCPAAEQHLSVPGGEVKTDRHQVKRERDEDLLVISDEEQCTADEGDQGDRLNQNLLSQSLTAAAEEDLQTQHSEKMAFNKLTATQASGFAPTGKPPLTLSWGIPKSPISHHESLDSSFLKLNPAESITETSRARNSFGSVIPKQHPKSVPASSIEPKAQLGSSTPVTFFELEASVDDQLQLQLSPPEHGTTRMGFSGNVTENSLEERELSRSGHPSASPSPERENTDHPSAPSNQYVLKKWEKKKTRNPGDIKVLKDWLVSHYPTETREIYELPPEDLDHYLTSFYSSAKRQDGREFSATSFHFFQGNIERYLKGHNYEYSVIRGLEFRGSQEALKSKHHQLAQKEREEEWSVLENLTDEDVANLRKSGLLSRSNPQGFLHLIFINTVRGFGARTHSQSHSLYWGQLVLKETEEELEYLEWVDDLRAEGSTGAPGAQLFAQPDSPETCPVEDYKEYSRRRPPDTLNDCHPLYLAPRPQFSMWDQVWFCRKALAKAKLEKMLKVIIQQLKIHMKNSKQ
ncbi:uncharacterized protein KIAA1958 homolog [Heliangelus exortis]|uniref:uncharacterized protein KIAA1958 homolog n=1 Tax=Heliangelus exortis TaxID=472823 RepID=UPI003A9111F6